MIVLSSTIRAVTVFIVRFLKGIRLNRFQGLIGIHHYGYWREVKIIFITIACK